MHDMKVCDLVYQESETAVRMDMTRAMWTTFSIISYLAGRSTTRRRSIQRTSAARLGVVERASLINMK